MHTLRLETGMFFWGDPVKISVTSTQNKAEQNVFTVKVTDIKGCQLNTSFCCKSSLPKKEHDMFFLKRTGGVSFTLDVWLKIKHSLCVRWVVRISKLSYFVTK